MRALNIEHSKSQIGKVNHLATSQPSGRKTFEWEQHMSYSSGLCCIATKIAWEHTMQEVAP